MIHEYTFALLRRHFVQRTAPTAETRDHLLDYTLRALRAGPVTSDDPAA